MGGGWGAVREQGIADDPLEKYGPEDTESEQGHCAHSGVPEG